MSIIPAPIQTRRVVARYVNLIADTALDEDEQPDAVYPTGRVVFTRVAGPSVWADTEQADGTTVKVTKLPIEVPIDPDTGEIKLPHAPSHGIRLPVGQWRVQEMIGGRTAAPWTLTLEPDDDDTLVDLHTQAPIAPDPTVVLVPSLETMERAEAAADRAEAAEGLASTHAQNASTSAQTASEAQGQAQDAAADAQRALADFAQQLPQRTAEALGTLVQRGPWDPDATYAPGEVVSHDGRLWFGLASNEQATRTQHLRNPRFAGNADGWSILRDASHTVIDRTLSYTTTGSVSSGREMFHSGKGVGWAAHTTEGDVWSMALTLGLSASATAAVTLRAGIGFGPDLPVDYSGEQAITLQPGQTVRITSENVPTTAGRTTACLYVRTAIASLPAGVTVTAADPILEQAPTVGDYFDGSMDDTPAATFEWTGTPDASPSTMAYYLPLTGEPGTSDQWALIGQVGPGGGGTGLTVSDTPPTGGLWVNTSKEA